MDPQPAFRPSDNPTGYLAKVKPLFDQGLTYTEIAKAIGSKRATVAAFCRDNLVSPNDHRNISHNARKGESRRTVPNGKARQVLQFVANAVSAKGYSPTYREIADNLNLSVAGAFYQIRILKDYGWLMKAPGISRTVVLTPEGFRALQGLSK